MRLSRRTKIGVLAAAAVVLAGVFVARELPSWCADALLHPPHDPLNVATPAGAEEVEFAGEGVTLKGWRFRAARPRRGTIVYLHGVAGNRRGADGIARRFGPRGFDVVAYDSRAHGQSGGEACTYGYYEKLDLRRVLDALEPGPVVLIGASMGAAVALQAAADDARIRAVVAAEAFSDLRTIARRRAPFLLTDRGLAQAESLVEQRGRFRLADVSPVAAAGRITAAVLLIHGAADRETPPEHSRRIFEALPGRKRLILVPDAGHNESLRGDTWRDVEEWIDGAL